MALTILSPLAEGEEAEEALASPVHDLNGKVIGFIDNGWWSLKVTLRKLQELFEQRYNAEIIWKTKRAATASPEEAIQDLADKADMVICGLAN
ncbi:MAG: hypothetical protein HYX92_06780 [Chloroflexi bacterium]|nr:hypothetical protein [Chloroflexota bacterium]